MARTTTIGPYAFPESDGSLNASNWSAINDANFGAVAVSSNRYHASPESINTGAWWTGSGTAGANHFAKFQLIGTIDWTGDSIGVLFAGTDGSGGNQASCYRVMFDNAETQALVLSKKASGGTTFTQLAINTSHGLVANDYVVVDYNASTGNIKVYEEGNSTPLINYTDGSPLSGTLVGLWAYKFFNNLFGDNFEAGNVTADAVDAGDVIASRTRLRKRPGRTPYSVGRFNRPSIDVYPFIWPAAPDVEAVAAADSSTANAAFNSAATDSVSAADSADAEVSANQSTASDAVSAIDNASATGVFVVAAADSISINDAAVSTQGAPIVSDRTGTARPRPGRTPYSVGKLFRPRIDVYTNTFNQTAAESVAAVDAASTTIVGVASASDAISIADSASTQIVVAAAASDAVSINDSAIGTAAGDRDAADAINIDDSGTAIIVGTAFAAETLALGDSADSSLFGNVLFAVETFAPSDAADTAGSVYVGTAAEAQLLADLASAVKIGAFEPGSNSRSRVDKKPRVTKGRIGGRRI
jgi:hypothetical protein